MLIPYIYIYIFDGQTGYTGFDLLLVIFLFSIQIYCDFSGYSDIAIGTAKLLGIRLMTNFNCPYFSASIKEFWGRWHISLSTWFRDYVYIPLGGNRCSRVRHRANLLITFLVSGLWHGANWTFVIWGGIHGVGQVIEDIFSVPLAKLRENRIGHMLCVLVTFLFCSIAWVFFRADSLSEACAVLHGAFSPLWSGALSSYCSSKLIGNMIDMCKLGLLFFNIGLLMLYDANTCFARSDAKSPKRFKLLQIPFYFLLALLIVFCSQKGVAAEFVYFQF